MEVLILDPTFDSVGVVDSFESFIWTDRYSKHGDFEIYAPVESVLVSNLQQGYYLWNKDSEHIMVVEDRYIDTDIENGNYFTVKGRSIEVILDRRIIWNRTVLSGSFQSGIEKLINENVINPTDPNRKIDNFVFESSEDPEITSLTIEAQFKGENLYSTIEGLCLEKNIGFKVTLTDDNKFKFKLYSGSDRSYSQITNSYVVFSPKFENLLDSNYAETSRLLRNVSLVEGVEGKTVIAGEGTTSGIDRREMFTDATDLSNVVDGVTITDDVYLPQLTQRGSEHLSENKFIKTFEGQVETTQLFKYGEDFFLGDILQIANEYGMESSSQVVEIVYCQDMSGVSVIPTFMTM